MSESAVWRQRSGPRAAPVVREAYVYGAGGHSQVVADVLRDMGYGVRGFVNDYPERVHRAVTRLLPGVRVLPRGSFPRLAAPVVLAIGNNRERQELVSMLDVEWISAIHSSAVIAPTVRLGRDLVVLHRSVIQANAVIGDHVLINTAASVDHDNVIGDYVSISPHCTLCGHVEVGEGTFLGAGTTVIPKVKIGRWCTIGAGSLVIRDLPDHSTAFGAPARIVKRG